MIITPYLLTFLIGYLGLKALMPHRCFNVALTVCLSSLLGIAESIFICFFGLILFNRFHWPFIFTMHIVEIALLVIITRKSLCQVSLRKLFNRDTLVFSIMILFCGTIAWLYARPFPYGGWDAWAIWNLKSKFLALGGADWKNMFDPALICSNTHYPFALPLFNAWTWSFIPGTPQIVPLANAVIFNMILGGLIFGFLKDQLNTNWAVMPVLFLFMIPAYMIYLSSQYADIFISLFFIASLFAVYKAHLTKDNTLLIAAGIFLGLLSFIKNEGMALAGIIFLTSHFYLLKRKDKTTALKIFWLSTVIAGIPTLIFLFFLKPENLVFINGLLSETNPTNIFRLKNILLFFVAEFINIKWTFFWCLILLIGILNSKSLFKKEFVIFYTSLGCYLIIIVLNYFINTYYEILWWLPSSLSRVLGAVIPGIIIWACLAIFKKDTPAE